MNLSFNSTICIFNIITTNKNKTEIAPIYTTKNNIAINSIPNNNNNIVEPTKVNIKYNIECTGFALIIIIKAELIIKHTNIKNKLKFIFPYLKS